ncbi:Site-specific recombinase XerD [Rhizobiales bacterium GAS188]|nr:Site-specific recombinase XerD [Rhizobiales bacterium GAS188]
MSVYRPKKSPHFHYDFRFRGHRFTGTTGSANRRDAKAVETVKRADAAKELDQKAAIQSGPMTINIATDRYWLEVGQFHKRSDNTLRSLGWLTKTIGKSKLLTEITNPVVAEIVAKRRGGGVKPATVNRYVTEMLRKVIYRARDVWEVAVAKITWKLHLLKEPKERVRELSADEERRLFAALKTDYHPIVLFALKSGCRLAECVGLTWSQVDWGNRLIRIHGKGDVVDTIPMSTAVRDLLWPLQNYHETKVFTYVDLAGDVCPITMAGLDTAFGRAIDRAGIVDFRYHDLRHTMATRLLRAKGNLRIVQKVLRHTTIATTTKYAHALDADIRDGLEAMEAASEAKSPGKTPGRRPKRLKRKG